MTPKAERIAAIEALFGRCSHCAADTEFANRVARVVARHIPGAMDGCGLRSMGAQLINIYATRNSSGGTDIGWGASAAVADAVADVVDETAPHISGEMERRGLRSRGAELHIEIITRYSPGRIEIDVNVSELDVDVSDRA